jgi:mannose-1-phosphate guanylyltransferase/mannose-6-phosphate isomerase
MREVLPFILCGGSGTRLWPLSREAFPKQFHRITGPETLFQLTCRRLTGDLFGELSVLSNRRHRFLVAAQLAEIGQKAATIVLEPCGRNTAPAACTAALIAATTDPNAIVLLAPSDQMIADVDAFVEAVRSGLGPARDGALVTFGVVPDCPHTGYGYIETIKSNGPVLGVKRLVEKPTRETAETYLDSGDFYWNAGIFMFKAATLIELLEVHAPEILTACRRALDEAVNDLDFLVLGDAYGDVPSISLDYAVAEKAGNLACVPLRAAWSDVGSWAAIWNFLAKDPNGNVVQGDGKVVLTDTSNASPIATMLSWLSSASRISLSSPWRTRCW